MAVLKKTIEVWSALEARHLASIELKDVLFDEGRTPSYDKLVEEVRPFLSAHASPPCQQPGMMEFVHVLRDDGTNTSIHSQEVLEMEWNDWRQRYRTGKKFQVWVRDCNTERLHRKAQPPIKYGARGWNYHPLNGTATLVKLPLMGGNRRGRS